MAAVIAPVSSAHSGGWWWTVQKATQTIFWWSATHHLDTTCKGIGSSIASPFVEYRATDPTVAGDPQAERGQPLLNAYGKVLFYRNFETPPARIELAHAVLGNAVGSVEAAY